VISEGSVAMRALCSRLAAAAVDEDPQQILPNVGAAAVALSAGCEPVVFQGQPSEAQRFGLDLGVYAALSQIGEADGFERRPAATEALGDDAVGYKAAVSLESR
jgi:hypothetical protein